MVDESDADLLRVFAAAREPLTDEEFVGRALLTIERKRRVRWWRRGLGLVVAAIVVAMNVRSVLGATAALVGAVGEYAPTYSQWMISPGGWAVSLVVGVWVVLRFRPSRR